MPEEFFKLLVGDINIFIISLESPILIDLLTFILYLIMISGRTLDVKIEENIVKIINYKDNKNYIKLPVKKILFQDEIDYLDNYENPDICILTCNRYNQLERCLNSYITNLRLFGHENVNITIFDDSKRNVDKNIDICQKYNSNIITLEKKYEMINNLIRKVSNYPEHIINSINHSFGNFNFNTSFGRNRNFISFFMKEKSYISLDDDSLPFVLTYKANDIKEGLKKFIKRKHTNLSHLKFFLPKNCEKMLIPVDFYYKFKYSNSNELQYVKYSGQVDMELLLIFFEQLGINLNHHKILEYLNEPIPIIDKGARLFLEEKRKRYDIRGLCIFYPKNTYDFRVTISENYRIEDLILGINYKASTDKIPLEVNISLYHDKDLNFYIKFEDIIKEFNGTTICSLYYDLMRNIVYNTKIDPITDLFNITRKLNIDFFDEKNIEELNHNRNLILNLFNNLSKDFSVLKTFIPKIEYFFSIFDIDYINNEANRVISNLASSMFMWKELKEITF